MIKVYIYRLKIIRLFFKRLPFLILLFPLFSSAQLENDSIIQNATIENVVRYALQKNPLLKNASIQEQITETQIRSKLADWYPQVNFNYNVQHYFQLPTANFNGQYINTGTNNTSGLQVGATQNIFNRDVILASRTARDIRLLSQQNTHEQKINIAVEVSKAFYDVILTLQQLKIIDEDINRINLSLKDAFYQYKAGIVDKTDYKRATISLNNAKSQRKNGEELLKSKYANLKELMGYPSSANFELQYDTSQMKQDIYIDTLQPLTYNNRIEFQLLQTQKALQEYNVKYNQWSFLPDVYAFGDYNVNFLNNTLTKIYNRSFPNSYVGVALSIPIFQGGKRLQLVKQARLQLNQIDYTILNLQNTINAEYEEALAGYKTHLYDYFSEQENVALAQEVYDVIMLQYRSGIKSYIEVINSETDLRTAEINYYNALYQVLSSKIDVQKALGILRY